MEEQYTLLHGSSKFSKDLERDDFVFPSRISQRVARVRALLPWILHAILILTSMTLFILSLQMKNHDSCKYDPRSNSIMEESWETTTFPRRFEGSVKSSSPYKGPPSDAVNEAWEKLLPLHLMRITESEFQSINASKHSTKLYDQEGGRIALFEAIHMIHCVKSLWENTYPEYYSESYAYNQAHQDEWHMHADHCADMLRQKLMCEADASLITYNWLKHHYYPHPNFNVEHQCRNYSRLVEVAETRKVAMTFPKPEGKPVIDFVEAPFDPEADS